MKRASKATKDVVNALIKNEPFLPSPIKFRTDKPGFFQLTLHVKPGARVSRVAEITPDFVGVQIAAPPRDGEANEEVVRYFAEILTLKERQVTLISGMKSRDKTILVENVHNRTAEQIQTILQQNQD